jgi:hypothetical protein
MRINVLFNNPIENTKNARLVLNYTPDTGVEIVAFWRGYDSLLRCGDVAEDLTKLCEFMFNARGKDVCGCASKYNYALEYA